MSCTHTTSTQRHGNWAWIWLAYTGFLFISPIFQPSLRLWLGTLTVFAIFLGIFTLYIRASGQGTPTRFWMIAATFLLGLAVFPWNPGGSTFFVYTAAFLPFNIASFRRLLSLFLAEVILVVADGYLFHVSWPNVIIAIFLLLIIGCGNVFFAEQKRADSKLRMAQEEIEQLAALAERERIARDLHDVLGHTLSIIVLKAELAGRLIERGPHRLTDPDIARAACEIADIERTARTALAEVREAIGGYRAKGLAAELEMARNTLAAAGVALSCESAIPRLNATEETVLALAVREAVTNIVRHARAQHCRMSFETTADGFHSLRVEDDGAGIGSTLAFQQEGNGLRGMRERVQSLGGRVSISSCGKAAADETARPQIASSGTTLLIELPAQSNSVSVPAPACVSA